MIAEIIYYDDIEILPLWSFNKYKKTKDLNFLIEGYDGRQPKVTDEAILTKLKEIEEKVITQYFEALDDYSYQIRLRKVAQLEVINTRYITVMVILDRLSRGFGDSKEQLEVRYEYISTLAKLGFKMPVVNSIEGDMMEVIRISNEVKGLKNKANILISELKIEGKNEEVDINKQLIQISRALELGYKLAPKEISVLEYIQYMKLVEDKIKQDKKKDK